MLLTPAPSLPLFAGPFLNISGETSVSKDLILNLGEELETRTIPDSLGTSLNLIYFYRIFCPDKHRACMASILTGYVAGRLSQ